MTGGEDVATLVERKRHLEEPHEIPGQSLQQKSAEKNARQMRWSSSSLPTNGAGAVPATNVAVIGTIGTVTKSVSQLSIDDAIDAKRRAARKTKRQSLKLRHYQIRRQRETTEMPLVSSSSSSEDDSEEEYELNRTTRFMEENDRVWWPR